MTTDAPTAHAKEPLRGGTPFDHGAPSETADRSLAVRRVRPHRRRFSATLGGTVDEFLDPFEPGISLAGLTGGNFSLIELILAIVERIGPCDVIATTWSMGLREIDVVGNLRAEGRFRSFRVLTDRNLKAFKEDNANSLIALLGAENLYVSQVHAKIALLRNERWNIAVRSSMNWNRNPRIENVDLDDDATLCAAYWDACEDMIAACRVGGSWDGARDAYDRALLSGVAKSGASPPTTQAATALAKRAADRERALKRRVR